jgi:hypothetical protein
VGSGLAGMVRLGQKCRFVTNALAQRELEPKEFVLLHLGANVIKQFFFIADNDKKAN